MLALYLMTVVGMFAAVVASFAYMGQGTIVQLTDARVEAAEKFFDAAANILLNGPTRSSLELVGVASCPGITATASELQRDPRSLLCRQEVLQLASWDMKTGVQDPWSNQVYGITTTERVGVGPGVMAPVTAFAFISAGPDRVLSPGTQAMVDTARASTDIRSVSRISADPDSDDIVKTYTNISAQMSRWQRVEDAVKRIAAAAQDQYMQDFYNFEPQIQAHLQSLLDAGYTIDQVLRNPELSRSWKNLTDAAKPALFQPESNPHRLGVDEEYAIITNSIPAGSGLRLSTTIGNSSPTFPNAQDTMSIRVANHSSPWGNDAGQINYVYYFEMDY